MSSVCPDWPALMEVAPDLHFKHYTIAEAQLPGDALVKMPGVSFADVAVCCDLEHNVFNPAHTAPEVADALAASHWFELGDWRSRVGS